MRQFDPQVYLSDVLGPYRDSSDLPSLFERYLLDFDDSDDDAIEGRLEEVKRYWDKQREHARYGAIVRKLVEKHSEARLRLADATERAREVEKARSQQEKAAERERKGRDEWERLLRETVAAAGGLDPARRARLESLAHSAGIPEEELRRKLDSIPEVREPEVLATGIRKGIATRLSALEQALEEPRVGRSLYHALGLDITAEPEEVRSRREVRVAENNKRSPGTVKEAWKEVLSDVKLHLLDGDPGAYVNGLVADVREALDRAALMATTGDETLDPTEAEQLRQSAIELGLSPELAERVVAELARKYGAVVQMGERVDLVSCPACNRPHGTEAEHCSRCGAALYVDCPGCGERVETTASRCSNCGTDLHRHAAAVRSLERLPELLTAGRLEEAREALAGVTQILGTREPRVAEAARTLRAAEERARRAWAEVAAARAERRLYAARKLLTDLAKEARDFRGDTGELPAEALGAVEARIGEAEALLQAALRGETAEREGRLVEVLHRAADCAEAEHELDKLPPEPPAVVEVEASGVAMSVRWQPSPTAGVSYAVTRVTLPAAVEARVGETRDLRIEDPTAPAGALVRYRVTATRGRACSAPAGSEPVVAAFEVRGLTAAAGDGRVDLSWTPLGDCGRVVIERSEDGGSPVAIAPDLTGASDRDVVNGRRYSYRVFAEYPSPGGGVIQTNGQTVFAQPVERPKPLEGLRVRAGRDRVELEFEPPAVGSVVVFRSARDPEVAPGATLDPGRLADFGAQLRVQGAVAVDADPPAGSCFYLPVTTAGDLAVAGAAVRHVQLPEIDNAQIVANGRQARVTWTWPEQVTIARVAWHHDRRPDGPEDLDAERVDYRLGEYRDNGGFTVSMGEHQSLFVAIFPAARAEGEVVYGLGGNRGSWAMLRSEEKTPVRYSVRRVGGFRKRLEVEVSEPEGKLPELVLVGREGDILPRSVADGKVLARLGGDGPRASSLEMRELSRPLAVKLFLESAAAGGSHILFDPMVDELLIS